VTLAILRAILTDSERAMPLAQRLTHATGRRWPRLGLWRLFYWLAR
jgi:hypothetical protein